MIGIEIDDQLLQLYPNTRMALELNNPAYMGGDFTIVPGSFALPIKIPLSAYNKSIIGHVDRIDRPGQFLKKYPCNVYFQRKRLFPGLVTVKKSANFSADLYIIINEVVALKDINLREMTLDGVRNPANDTTAWLAHMLDTATNPLNHDYIFFPVRNDVFFNQTIDDPGTVKSTYQNYFVPGSGAFEIAADQQSATPFVRVDYLLDQIMTDAGFTFVNAWQTTDELKKLVLYNNRSLYLDDVLITEFELKNHLPDETAGDFIKKIMRVFCLGMFYNYFTRTVTLRPLSELIDQVPAYDWTSKAGFEIEIDDSIDYPVKLCYYVDDTDQWFEYFTQSEIDINGEFEFLADLTGPKGTYYIISENAFYNFAPGGAPNRQKFFKTKQFLCYDSGEDGEGIEIEIAPLFMSYGMDLLIPIVRTFGSHEDFEIDADFGTRFVFYRGFEDDANGDSYPLASNNIYNRDGDVIADHALIWNSDAGIFAKFWSRWFYLLQTKKTVKRKMVLSIADVLNFDFQNKIRIHNTHFFVKKLSLVLTNRGIEPATVEMITTI